MTDLIIKKTRVTPEVTFRSNGDLTMEGVTLPEDAGKFYHKLVSFIENLESENIQLTIKFDYINTTSAKQLYLIFKALENKSDRSKITIDWNYPEDDEDIYDSGKHYESLFKNINFRFVAYADA